VDAAVRSGPKISRRTAVDVTLQNEVISVKTQL